ncbi:MAG: DUF2382 domain-containing protein [Nitrospiraceae bacterium]|nr:DUF2382 domain-containing protein [Nitrospiraceae bacterium]
MMAVTALAAFAGMGCQAASASGQGHGMSQGATAWRVANTAPSSSAAPDGTYPPPPQQGSIEESLLPGTPSPSAAPSPKRPSSAKPSSTAIAAPSFDRPTTIPIIEEQLQVGTRTIEGDTVSITIKPIEIPVRESVQLRTEHIVVERAQGNGRPMEIDEHAFEPKTIELTEMTEVPMAAIRPVVTNMVTIRKESRQRTEHVQDQLRGNTVDIVREPQLAPEARKTTTVVPTGELNTTVSKAVENTLHNNVRLPASIAEVKQDLMIDKREVPEAIVRVQIRPTARPVEQAVSLREEYVVVERAPVTTSTGDVPADVFKDKTFYVKTQKEVPVITKRPVLKEMLTIRKDTDTQQRTIEAKLLETSVALADPLPQTAR